MAHVHAHVQCAKPQKTVNARVKGNLSNSTHDRTEIHKAKVKPYAAELKSAKETDSKTGIYRAYTAGLKIAFWELMCKTIYERRKMHQKEESKKNQWNFWTVYI